MSSSNSPCAACKVRRQKCTQDCVFAPYFPADQPQRFVTVHKIFGASNVAKLLNELSPNLRGDAVASLTFEAEARLQDQVYGCVKQITSLQQRLKLVHDSLCIAKKELSIYIGHQAFMPMLPEQQQLGTLLTSPEDLQHDMLSMMGMPTGPSHGGRLMIRDPQQQKQIFEAQQLTEKQEMLRINEKQQLQQQQGETAKQQLQQHQRETAKQQLQQHQRETAKQQLQQQQRETARFNNGFNASAGTGFKQTSVAAMYPNSLAPVNFDNPYQVQAQQQSEHHVAHSLQSRPLLQSQRRQTPLQTQQQQKPASDPEGR